MNLKAYIKGGQIPNGRVKVSGAKNAAVKLLSAALLTDETIHLENFPTELVDAKYQIDFFKKIGVSIDIIDESILINPENMNNVLLDDYFFPIRTTYLFVAGLLKKSGRAFIPYPGGCNIGNRGYDLHVMIWEKLGAKVIEHDNYIEISAPNGFKTNQVIDFPISTIGGTENALLCASIVEGTTSIKNAYITPEVNSLIDFLRTLGVNISVVGNSFITVRGKKRLRGSRFRISSDRIEALTWIIYGILSKGNITIEDVPFEDMEIPLLHLKDAGIDLYRNSKNISISPDCLPDGVIQPFEVATGTHPGIISDMQPFYVLLGLFSNGISRIYDFRYPERIKYCFELLKFFPDMLAAEHGKIKINGNTSFSPIAANAESTDLRGSMAVVIAALLSDGDSTINNVEMALRGYNNLEEKLKQLGVEIEITGK